MDKNKIKKPTKNWFKGGEGTRKSNRRGEFGQSTLHACIGISESPLYALDMAKRILELDY
jgi:hypothetical protein